MAKDVEYVIPVIETVCNEFVKELFGVKYKPLLRPDVEYSGGSSILGHTYRGKSMRPMKELFLRVRNYYGRDGSIAGWKSQVVVFNGVIGAFEIVLKRELARLAADTTLVLWTDTHLVCKGGYTVYANDWPW